MSASKGRMLNRVSHWCEDSDLSNAKTKRQRRARGEREWRKAAEQEYLDAVWAAYYEDTRRLADDFGLPAERAHREAVEFANEMLAAPQRRGGKA